VTTTLTVVTGGSSGIGLAFVRDALERGDRVLEVSRSGPPAELRDRLEHIDADLARPSSWPHVGASVAAAVARLEEGDRVIALHAAATIAPIGFAGEVDGDAYTAAALLNAAAPPALGALLLRACVHREDLRRQLCMISSGASTSAYAGWSAYCAGKAATDQWVRTVGVEQAERGGVEVSAVAPGVVETGMQEQIRGTDERDQPTVDRFRQLHEQGELDDPTGVALRLRELLDRGTGQGAVLDLRQLG